jgi:hypothetical protein
MTIVDILWNEIKIRLENKKEINITVEARKPLVSKVEASNHE